ncbi:hypothetical protein [Micrococcus sp. TA1]|uniref:hypothetical protein n=1 Tax=Micrococcus sp. TA1 TaxID=681627 RepID=UPI001621171A|nr:hypothetical protein [Micrococcus sp. TA1]MBB5747762.1 hypothetical protein [Micrococcus sp. TA1]
MPASKCTTAALSSVFGAVIPIPGMRLAAVLAVSLDRLKVYLDNLLTDDDPAAHGVHVIPAQS